jgi:hypothetical protein
LAHGATTRRRRAAHTPAAINDPAATIPTTVAAPNPSLSLPSSPRSTVPTALFGSDVVLDELVAPSATASSVVVDPATSVVDVDVDALAAGPTIDDEVVVDDDAAAPAIGALVARDAVATGASETTCVAGGTVGAAGGATVGAGAAAVVVVGDGALDGAPQSERRRGLGGWPSIGGGGG